MTKAYYSLFFTFLFIITSLVIITGCEYDVTDPQWEKPYSSPPTPQITSIEPAGGAAPGINYITINGENFLDVPNTNGVYFSNITAEIVSNSRRGMPPKSVCFVREIFVLYKSKQR